ncbi:MAG: efflux RND transporter periplasmic adaptor subunit, partial [Herbaspirillum sp.]
WRSRTAVAPKAPMRAHLVKTVLTQQQSLPITLSVNGSVTALNMVDVRPQVQNVVRAVHVREGQDVQAGQLLFTLDERSSVSNVAQARAQVAAQRADLADAQQLLTRNQELLTKNFISRAAVDSARNKADALRAALQASEAALQANNVAAGYNQIRAGISGRIGAISVHVGSLAQPAGTPLLTIYQMDPIAISFAVPERELAVLRASYPNNDAPVVARLSAGGEITGKLIFIDNAADPQSGTVLMKASFANANRQLWPSTFVSVRLTARTLADAVTLPAQSVITGPTETFVYLVQADQAVRVQPVKVIAIVNGVAAVSGLKVGQRVVVEGAQDLRAGAKVREAKSTDEVVPTQAPLSLIAPGETTSEQQTTRIS